jgi:hypothetical protein
MRGLHPFIADKQNRLGEVKRSVSWIDRKADDLVGERNFFVSKAGPLGTKQDAEFFTARYARCRLDHRFIRGKNGLHLAAFACGGGEDAVEVGDSLFEALKKPG